MYDIHRHADTHGHPGTADVTVPWDIDRYIGRYVGQDIGWDTVAGAGVPLVLAATYLVLAARARRRNPARPPRLWPAVSFLTGCALLAVALLPPLATWAHDDFRGHMLQHLVVGMYVPLALILGTPVTLLLRALPARRARHVTRALSARPVRVLAHPVTGLLLSAGTLPLLYFTPLYDAVAGAPAAHGLLHAHFLLAGCLFAWSVAGAGPGPARPSVPARLVVLGVAVAVHAIVAQLMYGGFLIDIDAPAAQVRTGAQLMYYGGDIAELLLAGALVATWRPAPGHARVRTTAPAPVTTGT